jgi:hypothetical protein
LPNISLSQSELDFGEQYVGTTSSAQTVTLTNTGTDTLIVSSVSISGDYFLNSDCTGIDIEPDEQCSIYVQFTPESVAVLTGMVTITANTLDQYHYIDLMGEGISGSGPDASLSATSHDFGNTLVGETSDAYAITLTNIGNATLNITGITTSGDFVVVDNCGASLAPDASCTMDVAFTPQATGVRLGTLAVSDNASDSPQKVLLTGRGINTESPTVVLSATELDFGEQQVGASSGEMTVTLTNTGPSNLITEECTIEGDDPTSFAIRDQCYEKTVLIDNSCTISVIFTPDDQRALSARLKIPSNALSSPDYVTLTGTGVNEVVQGLYIATDKTTYSPGETVVVSYTIRGVEDQVNALFGAILPNGKLFYRSGRGRWYKTRRTIARNLNPRGYKSGTLRIRIPSKGRTGIYSLAAELVDSNGAVVDPGIVIENITVQ